jgi:hypothetical protein
MATDSIKDLLSVTKDDNSDFVRDIKARWVFSTIGSSCFYDRDILTFCMFQQHVD